MKGLIDTIREIVVCSTMLLFFWGLLFIPIASDLIRSRHLDPVNVLFFLLLPFAVWHDYRGARKERRDRARKAGA